MTKRKDPKDYLKRGRPTNYRKEYGKVFIENMAKGLSKFACCGIIGIHEGVMYNWVKKHPEFDEAIKEGEKKSILYFEKVLSAKVSGQSVKGFDHKKSDTSCLIFALKTRFHNVYGEKREIDLKSSDGTMSPNGFDLSLLSSEELAILEKVTKKIDDTADA